MTTRSVVRNAVRSAVYSAVRPASRYIHTLDSAGGMYYDLATDINPTGDFVIRGAFSSNTIGGVLTPSVLSSADVRDGLLLYVAEAEANLILRTGIASSFQSAVSNVTLANNKIYSYVLTFTASSNTYALSVEGETPVTLVRSGVSNDLAFVGVQKYTVFDSYYDGSILDLKVWDAGTLVLDVDFNTTLASATVPDRSASGNDLTATNMTSADSELFRFREGNPDAWVAADGSPTLEYA